MRKSDELIKGKKYAISIQDCCVEAELEGVYLGVEGKEDDLLLFDIGVFDNISAVQFKKMSND